MGLKAEFTAVDHPETGKLVRDKSWCAKVAERGRHRSIVLHGFGRKLDVEIAIHFLESLPVDWSLEPKAVWRQLAAAGYPDREALMRGAVQSLQW